MSAKGTGSHDDPQNPEKKIYTFTQKVKVFISTFYQLRMILMLHIVTSKNSSEHILHTVLFFFYVINIYWRNICTELNLNYSTHITWHHSTYHITVLIGLDTSTYFLLILTDTY